MKLLKTQWWQFPNIPLHLWDREVHAPCTKYLANSHQSPVNIVIRAEVMTLSKHPADLGAERQTCVSSMVHAIQPSLFIKVLRQTARDRSNISQFLWHHWKYFYLPQTQHSTCVASLFVALGAQMFLDPSLVYLGPKITATPPLWRTHLTEG